MDKLYFIKRGSNEKTDLTLPRKENSMYYELKHFVDLYDENKKESPINSFSLSLEIMDILDKIREKIGIVFPADNKK